MFNEIGDSTPYNGPTYPVNSPYGFQVPGDSSGGNCPPGQVNDYDPETGQFSATCVDDTAAYQAATGGGSSVINVGPKAADAWTNYVIYGGLALLAFAVISGGRR